MSIISFSKWIELKEDMTQGAGPPQQKMNNKYDKKIKDTLSQNATKPMNVQKKVIGQLVQKMSKDPNVKPIELQNVTSLLSSDNN